MSELYFKNNLNLELITPDLLFTSYIHNNDTPNFVLIVPTGKQVRKLSKDFIDKYTKMTGKPVIPPKIFTIQTLVEFLVSKLEFFNNLRFVSESFQLELIDQAVRDSDLEYFFRNLKITNQTELNRHMLERIFSIIYGLKEDGINPKKMNDDFINNIQEITNESRFKDIYKIYKNYQLLLSNKFMDYPEALILLNKLVGQKNENQFDLFAFHSNDNSLFENIFKKIDLFLIYGFSEFKLPELEFINNLSNIGKDFIINLDYNSKNGPIFGNLESAITHFNLNNFKNKNIAEIDSNPKKAFLREFLFEAEKKEHSLKIKEVFKKSDLFNKDFQIIEAKNKNDEVNAIAKLCKHLIHRENIKPHEICIASRKSDTYSTEFREAFKNHSIPANISDRYKMESSRPIISIISFLELIINGFNFNDLMKVLNSPYFNLKSDDYPDINTNNLNKVFKTYHIKSGKIYGNHQFIFKQIESKIKIIEKLKNYVQEFDNYDLKTIQNYDNQIFDLNWALSDLKYLISLVPKVEKRISLNDFASIIKEDIINKFKIKNKIFKNYYSLQEISAELSKTQYFYYLDEIEKDSNAINKFIEILDEMVALLKLRYKNYLPSFAELVSKLKISLSATKYQIKEKINYGVNITSMEQTRGFDFKIMILCGSIDGEIPISYSPEKFLGKSIPNSELKHFNSERMLFYHFINSENNIARKYYIFYPKFNADEELIRSQFIDSLNYVAKIEDIIDLNNSNNLPAWYKAISTPFELHSKVKNDVDLRKYFNHDQSILNFIDYYKLYSPIVRLNQETIEKSEKYPNKLNHIFSVSEIENYTNCPYQYFVSRLLYLNQEIQASSYLESLESGTIMHDIMFKFYLELQKREASINPDAIVPNPINESIPKFKLVKLNPEKKQYYLSLLFEIAEKEFEIVSKDQGFRAIQLEDFFSTEARKGKIETWLDYEIKRIQSGWNYAPALFELSFSKYDNIKEVSLSDFKLKGKIDRIELYSDSEGVKFLIADYKSGKNVASNSEIIEGKKFQMPLYIAAAKKILLEYYGINAINKASVYYIFSFLSDENQHKYALAVFDSSIEYNTRKKSEYLSKDFIENDEIIEQSVQIASDRINSIENGVFNIQPIKQLVCDYCSYSDICRINEHVKPQV